MNDVAKQDRKKSKGKQGRLNRLWKKAQRLQDENAQLSAELDALVDRVRRELAPLQAEQGAAARDLILHLLPFLRRKSLANWQRDEIRDWVAEQLELVVAAGLTDARLADALARDRALQLGIEIDEDSSQSAAEQVEAFEQEERDAAFAEAAEPFHASVEQAIEEEVEERVRAQFGSAKAPRSTPEVDDLFADELADAERRRAEAIEDFRLQAERDVRRRIEAEFGVALGGWDSWDDDEAPDAGFDDAAADGASGTQPTPDRGVLERLFRQAANALHPDKERDDERRADKQALMGTLLEARKHGDILTVFRLHHEYAGGAPELGADQEREFSAALEQQIERLGHERDAIIEQSPVHANIYHDLYGRSRKQIDRELAELQKNARGHVEFTRSCVREIHSLKALKPVLEERREDRVLSLLEDWPAHLRY